LTLKQYDIDIEQYNIPLLIIDVTHITPL